MTKLEHKYGAMVLDGYTYALDAAGEITRVTDQNSEYWDYAYDGRDRLTSAVRKNSGVTISGSYAYTYDDAANLLRKVEPFEDNFNDGDYTGWSTSGTWDASNHYMTRTSTGGTGWS
jgi:YD repeat-containing protein